MNTTRKPIYVLGHLTQSSCPEGILVVLTPTARGWRSRSTWEGAMNHEYASRQPLDEIVSEWITNDLRDAQVTSDRKQVLHVLKSTNQGAPAPPGAFRLRTFLRGDPSKGGHAAAERVLQYLERGC